jgi:hypothetical protein
MWYFSAKLENFEPDTWVVRNDLMDESNGTLYLFSLYWSITTLTTVGFGDINAGTNSERIICIIWMMFGVGFYSFTVGSISSVLSSIDTEASIVEERVEMIQIYAKDNDLDPKVTKEIVKSIKKKALKMTLTEEQTSGLLGLLSKDLRYKIAMD